MRLLQLTLEWQEETTEQCARVGSTRDTGGEGERVEKDFYSEETSVI